MEKLFRDVLLDGAEVPLHAGEPTRHRADLLAVLRDPPHDRDSDARHKFRERGGRQDQQ